MHRNLLTTRQVQAALHIDRTTIYRMVASGQLPAVRVGKQWRFSQEGVDAWLKQNETPSPTPRTSTLLEPSPQSLLFDSASRPAIQQVQDVLAELSGIMLVVTDMEGRVATQPSNLCPYYRSLTQHVALDRLCDVSWPQLAATLPLKPQYAKSPLGTLCARGFIRVDNRLDGMLVAGCIASDEWPPTPDILELAARRAEVAIDQIAFDDAAVHHLTPTELEKVLDTVQRGADIIAQIISQRLPKQP